MKLFPYDRNSDAPANPVEKVENYGFNKSAHVLLGNVEADYKIHGFEDLHLHVNLAGEYTTGGEYDHKNPQSTYAYYYGGESEDTEKKYNVVATAYAQYTKDFNKANHFDITAGYEYSHMKYWGNEWSRTMYPSTYEGKNDKGEALAGTEKAYDTSRWRGQTYLVSWYGRANYSLLDRYLLTFTARYDGSSRFADGHRWVYKDKNYIFHGGLGALKEIRTSGQDEEHVHSDDIYRIKLHTNRFEGYMKHAFIFNHEHGTNIAFMSSASMHQLDAQYGNRFYDLNEKNLYGSLMFETNFSTQHNLSVGLSVNHDYLVASTPTDQVLPAGSLTNELVTTLTTDVVSSSINQLTMRVSTEVPLSLRLGRILVVNVGLCGHSLCRTNQT